MLLFGFGKSAVSQISREIVVLQLKNFWKKRNVTVKYNVLADIQS